MTGFFLHILNKQDYSESVRHVLANPTYRSISRLSASVGPGEWYRDAIKNYLLKRLILAVIRLDNTANYYKHSVTISHRLLILWDRLTWSNIVKVPYTGVSIFTDTTGMVRACEERRDELAVFIGQIYNGEDVKYCLKRFNCDNDDLLESVHSIPLDEWSRLHQPTMLRKHWITLFGVPLMAVCGVRWISKLNINTVVDNMLHSFDLVRAYCQSWIVDPLVDIVGVVKYPHDRPLMIMSEAAVHADRRVFEAMVQSYAEDKGVPLPVEAVKSGDLSTLMQHYEQDIKRPISSALTGNLLRLLLIQLQKGKIDVETALLAVDKLLRANELNFALLTIIPASYLLWVSIRMAISMVTGKSSRERRRATLQQLEQIERLCNLSEGSERDRGLLIVLMYRLFDTNYIGSTEDLVDLLSPRLSSEQRRWTAFRIRSYHTLTQQ